MTSWAKIEHEERVKDLNTAKHEALGTLLGVASGVSLARKHPTVFDLNEAIDRLEEARKAFDKASAAYLDARLAEVPQ